MSTKWSIKLARQDTAGSTRYRVLTVKNSTAYAPGTWLEQDLVQHLCDHKYWDVTIVSYFDETRSKP